MGFCGLYNRSSLQGKDVKIDLCCNYCLTEGIILLYWILFLSVQLREMIEQINHAVAQEKTNCGIDFTFRAVWDWTVRSTQ